MGDAADNAEVVGDEQVGDAEFILQPLQKLEDFVGRWIGSGQATQNDNKASCRVETPPAAAPVGR